MREKNKLMKKTRKKIFVWFIIVVKWVVRHLSTANSLSKCFECHLVWMDFPSVCWGKNGWNVAKNWHSQSYHKKRSFYIRMHTFKTHLPIFSKFIALSSIKCSSVQTRQEHTHTHTPKHREMQRIQIKFYRSCHLLLRCYLNHIAPQV